MGVFPTGDEPWVNVSGEGTPVHTVFGRPVVQCTDLFLLYDVKIRRD